MAEPASPEVKPAEVQYPELEPMFSFGAFDIVHLSDDPAGMQVKTRNFLQRPPAKGLLEKYGLLLPEDHEGNDVVDIIKGDVTRAVNFAVTNETITPEEQLRIKVLKDTGMTDEKIQEYMEKLKQEKIEARVLGSKGEHTAYMNKYATSNKIGVRNITLNGDTLEADIIKVPFAFYNKIGTQEDKARGLTELANPSATAMIIKTADNKLLVQHRGLRNASFADMPGASAAGLLDDRRNQTRPGAPARLSEAKLIGNNLKETREEVGLVPTSIFGKPFSQITKEIVNFAEGKMEAETGSRTADLIDVKIVGFAKENVKIHDEFLLYAKSGRTAAEIQQIAKNAPKAKDEHDFEEQFFFIDATPQAIEKLLVEMKCPLPPTHNAAFLAAGYSMFVEDGKKEEGKEWMKSMEVKIKKNWEDIDAIVAAYYAKNPEKLKENKGANPKGYDPKFTPGQQGLPSSDAERKRISLDAAI